MKDEREVVRILRAGLEAKAEEADTAAPVVARARAEVARRRRARWSVGAAAAAVVVVVGGVAVATQGGGGSTPAPPAATSGASTEGPPAGTTWRTEYWRGVAVDVPPEWGYGGAPFVSGPGPLACYPEAVVGPDGARVEGSAAATTLGWVGRPIAVSDVCTLHPWIAGSPMEQPPAPYVWLGAAVEPGTVGYGDGFVEETVEVAGVTVTVGTDDAGLRAEILGSARPGHLCAPFLDGVPAARAGLGLEGRGVLLDAEVCAYRRGDDGLALTYATVVEPEDAAAAFTAAQQAPARPATRCADVARGDEEIVVLHATYGNQFGPDTTDRVAVFAMRCGGSVALGAGPHRSLTPAAVEPWARNGVPAVVVGPSGGKGAMIDSFIGPQG